MSGLLRTIGTLFVALVVSGTLAAAAQLQIGAWFDAGEEFIAAILLLAAFVLALTAAMGIATPYGPRAIDLAAAGTLAVLAVLIAAIEANAIFREIGPNLSLGEIIANDGPIIVEIIVPALLATLIQWWLVKRHVQRKPHRRPG